MGGVDEDVQWRYLMEHSMEALDGVFDEDA